MRCPKCDEWVAAPNNICPKCAFDLTLLRTLDDLRGAIRITRSETGGIGDRLRDLDVRAAGLELLILERFPSSTPQPPLAEPVDSTHGESVHKSPQETVSSCVELDEPMAEVPAGRVGAFVDSLEDRVKAQAKSPWVSSDDVEVRFGQKWLLIVGLFITVLAFGYFLKYSFDRNWIGPAGRVALAYLGGFGMLAGGELFRRRGFALFGLYVIGGSLAVLYFASYASFQIYDLVSQPVAFGLMVVTTALAGFLALKHDTSWLAVLGIIGGFLTPLVLSTGTDNQVALMTYMLILNGGILGIAAFKQWHLLNYLGATFTWLLFSAWYAKYYGDTRFWVTTVYLNLFFLTYALVPFVYYFVRQSGRRVTGFTITIPNAFIAFGYSFSTIQSHYSTKMVSVATMAYAVIFLSMAFYLYKRNRENLQAIVLLLGKGVLFLVITVPILFSEHWITVFWTLQGMVLLWAALRLEDSRLRHGAVCLILLAMFKLLFHDYSAVFGLRISRFTFADGSWFSPERWVTAGIALGSLFVAARMLKAAGLHRPVWRESLPVQFYGLFGCCLFIVLNVEVAAGFHEFAPLARFASISVLWAMFAIAMMLLGFARNLAVLRKCALGLFAATILKVFIRDMSNVNTPYRILSFFVLGLLLVGASYLYHRYRSRILPAGEEDHDVA